MAAKILLIEDDAAFRKAVSNILKSAGHVMLQAPNGRRGVELAGRDKPDLVVLDLMLPGIDGLEVCQLLKQNEATASIPILILTGNDKEGQDIACLDMGADDYLTKPVKAERLLVYCKALLRRSGRSRRTVTLGELKLDYGRKLVQYRGRDHLHLTPKEFGLLYDLALRSPEPRSRASLYREIWGIEAPSSMALRTVEVHVRRIRLKLGWRTDEWLATVSGRGYSLAPPPNRKK